MAIKLNGGANPTSVKYNGNNVNEVLYNGTKVWPDGKKIWHVYTSVSPAGAGTVTGGGEYEDGSFCRVKATPNPGYVFTKYTGTQDTSLNPRSIQVWQDWYMTANFKQQFITYTLNVGSVVYPATISGNSYSLEQNSIVELKYNGKSVDNSMYTEGYFGNKVSGSNLLINIKDVIKDSGIYSNPFPITAPVSTKKVVIEKDGTEVYTLDLPSRQIASKGGKSTYTTGSYTLPYTSGYTSIDVVVNRVDDVLKVIITTTI